MATEGLLHIITDAAELSTKCHPFRNVLVCKGMNVIRRRMQDTCMGSLYARHGLEVLKKCNIQNWEQDNQIVRINNTQYIATTKTGLDLNIKCKEAEHVQTIERGQQYVYIPANCTAEAADFLVQPTQEKWIQLPRVQLMSLAEWKDLPLFPSPTREDTTEPTFEKWRTWPEDSKEVLVNSSDSAMPYLWWVPLAIQLLFDIGLAALVVYLSRPGVREQPRIRTSEDGNCLSFSQPNPYNKGKMVRTHLNLDPAGQRASLVLGSIPSGRAYVDIRGLHPLEEDNATVVTSRKSSTNSNPMVQSEHRRDDEVKHVHEGHVELC